MKLCSLTCFNKTPTFMKQFCSLTKTFNEIKLITHSSSSGFYFNTDALIRLKRIFNLINDTVHFAVTTGSNSVHVGSMGPPSRSEQLCSYHFLNIISLIGDGGKWVVFANGSLNLVHIRMQHGTHELDKVEN